MEKEKILFTSESVTEGHPDKMCDAISDAILDAIMKEDPMGRVACETATTTGLVLVMGEITTSAYVDIQKIVRDTVREIGYTRGKYGFDAETCAVITAIDEQSTDIAMGVDKALEAKMGEDEIDAIGAGVGIVGGISNPFSVGIGSNIAGISLGDGILTRLVLFIACFIFAVFFVMHYAEKVRKDPTKSIVYDIRDITNAPFEKNNTNEIIEFTPKRKKVITIFGCMFLLMIIAIIPWGSKFGVHIFEDFHEFLTGIPILGSILGHIVPLGDWFFTEMTMLFLAGAVLIGIVYGFNEKKIVDLFIYGAKDILSVALILGVAKGLSVIMTDGLIIDTVLHYGEMLLSNISGVIFPAIAYILYIPMSLLIPSSSGLHTATIPILAPLGDFLNVGREFIVMACQAGSETMNFISPTQAVLIGALTLANVPYERWLKHILPFFFGIIAITCSVLTVGCIFF